MSPLISDLALILIVAGVVTIVFKRLKQPLVLGYIVAGFLAGPHMPYMPTVTDAESIEVWSSIGVIFLMFTLGLEFSFKKIVKMGFKPIFAACLVMAFMIGVGSTVGRLFHWSSSDCLFLGGMLAMSSTTIIYKAFEDLGLRKKKFAAEVLSVLILEDILGILLMVILSASAASAQFEGMELVMSLLKLGFFLILWFVVGVYLIPLFLSKTKKWMSGETLLIVAIGLCFLLVVLADKAGYSSAFGAFMMGSILAETVEAERIEHLVAPVKDLFGAIFFVSVGMLVNPQVLVDYWFPILAITLAIIAGQSILGTSAFVLAGHPLKIAMRCGFSLAQIGEFAFILAALGLKLGVTSEFLYPVVVAVSIVTTFLTPYMIKAAEPAYNIAEKWLPEMIMRRVSNTSVTDSPTSAPHNTSILNAPELSIREAWKIYIKAVLIQTGAYLVMTMAAITLSTSLLLSLCRYLFEHDGVDTTRFVHWVSNGVCATLALLVIGLFLRPIVMRKNHSLAVQRICRENWMHFWAFRFTVLIRFAIAVVFVYQIIDYLCPLRYYWNILLSIGVLLLLVNSRTIKYYSIRMERVFTHNLQRREDMARNEGKTGFSYARRLKAHDIHMERITVPARSLWAGKSLMDMDFTNQDGVIVASILRPNPTDDVHTFYRLNAPAGTTPIYPSDILEVIGDDASIDTFVQRSRAEVTPLMGGKDDQQPLDLRRFTVSPDSVFVGKTLAESGLHNVFHCMVVGTEDTDGHINMVTAQQVIRRHEILWLVGENQALSAVSKAIKPSK